MDIFVFAERAKLRLTLETQSVADFDRLVEAVAALIKGTSPEPRPAVVRESFGSRLRRLRRKMRITLQDLERLSGVSNAGISRIETGVVGAPRRETVHAICSALWKARPRRTPRGSTHRR